jgi:hypothetical protein
MSTIPGALNVTIHDPRLGSSLKTAAPGAPTLRAALHFVHEGHLSAVGCKEVRRLSKAVRARARATLEEEVLEIMAVGCSERDRKLIAACLEWRTKRRPTYRSVGKRIGVTYERVRQIFTRWLKAWTEEPPFAPILDRALALVQAGLPNWAVEVERQLTAAKLSNVPLTLKRLHDLAGLQGRKPAFVILGGGSQRSVDTEHDAQLIVQVRRHARRLVANGGVATMRQLEGPWLATPISQQCLAHALCTLSGFAWIDQAEGVFSLLKLKQNKLWTQIRKVLAVAPKVDVDVLWEAITCDHRFPRESFTSNHLLAYCRRHPACRVVGKTVIARDPENPRNVLRGDERTLVGYLNEHGLTSRRELFQFARKSDISRPSFNVCLNSPAITRYAKGVYGLIETSKAVRKSTRRVPQDG